MKPVDPVTPKAPGNWVQRTADKRPKRNPEKDHRPARDGNRAPGRDSDGRTHIIDELA